MINTVADLIEALGGTTATAKLCGVKPPAVSNWKKIGQLPARFFLPVMELCQSRGIEVNRELFGPAITASGGAHHLDTTPKVVEAAGDNSPLASVGTSARPAAPPDGDIAAALRPTGT
jgi:DNA-binding transcriptional regulator YdaS (Cro superfamily)